MVEISSIQKGVIEKGKGHFTYNQYKPLADKPLEIFYYAPRKKMDQLTIVFVMHGHARNASEYRDAWIDMAKKYDLLIIAPEFSNQYYPESRSYNLGNIKDSKNQPNLEEKWSFSVIEPLFASIKEVTNNVNNHYYLFGHSAGAQFVHRFMIFKPNNHVKKAVSANAGWYTMLNSKIDFPYGLKNSPFNDQNMERVFGNQLLVLLGEDDTDPHSQNLRRSEEVDFQGTNRLARGKYFFKKSKKEAKHLGMPFHWKINYVPNVGHDGVQMSKAAGKLLFE